MKRKFDDVCGGVASKVPRLTYSHTPQAGEAVSGIGESELRTVVGNFVGVYESLDDTSRTDSKPNYSYTEMIYLAVLRSPNFCLPIPEIYKYIMSKFPFFSVRSKGNWRNAVRHSLSKTKCFSKIAVGRGTSTTTALQRSSFLWCIVPSSIINFARGDYRCNVDNESGTNALRWGYYQINAGQFWERVARIVEFKLSNFRNTVRTSSASVLMESQVCHISCQVGTYKARAGHVPPACLPPTTSPSYSNTAMQPTYCDYSPMTPHDYQPTYAVGNSHSPHTQTTVLSTPRSSTDFSSIVSLLSSQATGSTIRTTSPAPTHYITTMSQTPSPAPTHYTTATSQTPSPASTHYTTATSQTPSSASTHYTTATSQTPSPAPTHYTTATSQTPSPAPTHYTTATSQTPSPAPTHYTTTTSQYTPQTTLHSTDAYVNSPNLYSYANSPSPSPSVDSLSLSEKAVSPCSYTTNTDSGNETLSECSPEDSFTRLYSWSHCKDRLSPNASYISNYYPVHSPCETSSHDQGVCSLSLDATSITPSSVTSNVDNHGDLKNLKTEDGELPCLDSFFKDMSTDSGTGYDFSYWFNSVPASQDAVFTLPYSLSTVYRFGYGQSSASAVA